MGSSSAPPPPPVQQELPPIPKLTDPEVKQARVDRRRLAALSQGRQSTILTSPQGLPSRNSPSRRRTLLGQ